MTGQPIATIDGSNHGDLSGEQGNAVGAKRI